MTKITIDTDRRCFIRNDRPFFYLADTAWNALGALDEAQFREYCADRASKGFNVIQMSALPLGRVSAEPFERSGGKFDYSSPRDEYFMRAERLLKIAREYKLSPCLHLFWANFIPDTWASSDPIPEELFESVARLLLTRLAPLAPFLSISGDTRFETGRVIRYYKKALDLVAELAPDSMATLHINPDFIDFVPRELTDHMAYRFASFQSGHADAGWIDKILEFTGKFTSRLPGLPLVNTEPCYENIGHYLKRELRFGASDVRRAFWLSLLGGAAAGFTYGAHGVWQCRLPNRPQSSPETCGDADDMFTALGYRGALDVAWSAKLLYDEGLFGLSRLELERDYASARVDGRKVEYFAADSNRRPNDRGHFGKSARIYDLDRRERVDGLPDGDYIVIHEDDTRNAI